MLQLQNSSPFKATIALFPDEDGIETLYVVVKATFQLGEELTVAETQVPPATADEYWGEPGASSVKYASEMHLRKPSTDVVLVGRAWAPEGRRVPRTDVGLAVGERRKVVRVFGDRVWRRGGASASPPVPFESLPLVYERAYGGVHDMEDGTAMGEDRNPVGRGFRGKRRGEEAEGRPLPNIEDPQKPIERWGDQAVPQGFGFIAPSWLPRRRYAGTYDEAWQQKRAPFLPEDFDSRFFNAAHPDLVCDDYLQGGEPVRLVNASRQGRLSFRLPLCRFDVAVQVGRRVEPLELDLETVLLEPEDERLCLVWRGAFPCDKQALKVEQVTIGLQSLSLGGVSG